MNLAAKKAQSVLEHLGASLKFEGDVVVAVSFGEAEHEPTTVELLEITRLPTLETIDLFGLVICEEVLRSVAALPVLKTLNLA